MRRGTDGGCYVVVPPPAHRGPPAPGARAGRLPATCTGILTKPLAESCLDATITRDAAGTCTCVGEGDPPFVTTKLRCP